MIIVQLFVGRDPLAIARHVRTLETISFHAGRYWPLEAALWDLFGQACGEPVATLLGGARAEVPAYASWGELRDPGQRAEDAHALVEEGFRAVKVRIARERIDEGVAVVAAIRAAVGERAGDHRRPQPVVADGRATSRVGLGPVDARRVIERLRGLRACCGSRSRCRAKTCAECGCCASRPGCGSAAARWRARSTSCAWRSRKMRSTCSSPTSCSRSASPACARWPSWRCGATGGSRRTPGRTGSGCWPTCTCAPASAAGRSSSSPTTRRDGRRRGATSCSPSR